ncbi:MAG: fumarylacetoacetate hydrolase family protein [Planctomycetota bacterium]|jgi:fumarylpyruvate hydrolase|nr:fumarylacetoacetate hydrolase family protein [Planctomycetota bacterium]
MSTTTSGPDLPLLPVGKILCVGRNYADHAKEMGAPPPDEPLLFLKPPTALRAEGGSIKLPTWSQDIHHEVELVVRIDSEVIDGTIQECQTAVDACAVGLDLTARDIQTRAKKRGHPWCVAKGWDNSAPISALVPIQNIQELEGRHLELEIDGERRQYGRLDQMIWSVPELIAFASHRFRLEPGDLLFTGTPSGVGPIKKGDRIVSRLQGLAELEVVIESD